MAPIMVFGSDSNQAVLEEAARVVRRGGVLGMPTESYYGLGAAALDEQAVRRVCDMKARPPEKPILVLIADRKQLLDLVDDPTPAAVSLMDRFWPGPLTLVMRAAPRLSNALTGGTGTVGVRQTPYPPLRTLLRLVGPLTGTSANRSGEPPSRTAQEVQAALGSFVDLILDAGPAPGGLPSTIVQTLGPLQILREGPVTQEQIWTTLASSDMACE
jgi:L-threonylcarbamoyladenylate synthase